MSQSLPLPRGNVGNLEVFNLNVEPSNLLRVKSPRDFDPVTSEDPRFGLVRSIVHIGLSLLECPQGKAWLVETGYRITEERKASGEDQLFGDGDRSEMNRWVVNYLQEVRSNFFIVCLNETDDAEALAHLHDWGNDINTYDSKNAGFIVLNSLVRAYSKRKA